MSSLWPRPQGALWPGADRLGIGGVPNGVQVRVQRRQLLTVPGSTRPQLGDWASAKEHKVDGVGLDRTSSSAEVDVSGDDETETATIWAPTMADIERGDRVIFQTGEKVTVVSIPNRQPNMINGWQPPMSARVSVTYG